MQTAHTKKIQSWISNNVPSKVSIKVSSKPEFLVVFHSIEKVNILINISELKKLIFGDHVY